MGKSRAIDSLTTATPAAARAAIAAWMESGREPARLGSVELEPHQLEAVSRLRNAIREFGGALNCDPVGTGKTFTALALAAGYRRPLVVAPAVLRMMWEQASERANVSVDFVSHEALSRSAAPGRSPDFVIVDEAHNARNQATRRYRSLASTMSGADAVFLTATPVHNQRADLVALISLFLGRRAETLTDAEIGRITVRREKSGISARSVIPRVAAVEWLDAPDNESIPQGILTIPPPLPLRDGGDGGALVLNSLVRQWASSDAALRGGLVRRRQRAVAMLSALESGVWPTRAELESWTFGEDSVQLGFAELLAEAVLAPAALLEAVRAHYDGVCRILRGLSAPSERDLAMAEAIRRLRETHDGSRIVAFSQYQDTVMAIFRALAPYGHVAALSGSGGIVSGGSITRREVLARFAPEASGASQPGLAENVSLLLTTDLLSEGVNLQDAAVVVHIDLPWTPARIEQRTGRLARMGSRHNRVYAYAFRPPASADRIVRIQRILDLKQRESEVVRDSPRTVEALLARIRSWLTHSGIPGGAIASAVVAPCAGFIAVCATGGAPEMVGSIGDRMGDDPQLLLRCAELAEGAPAHVEHAALDNAISAIESHFAIAEALAGVVTRSPSDATGRLLRRIASIVTRARPTDRPRISAIANDVRTTLLGRNGAHFELELARIASAATNDNELLETLASVQHSLHHARSEARCTRVSAIILFVPPAAARAVSNHARAGRT